MKGIYGIVAILAVVVMVISAIPMTEASGNPVGADNFDNSVCTIEFAHSGYNCGVSGMVWTQYAGNGSTIHLPSALLYKSDTIQDYNEYGILTDHYVTSYQTKWKLKSTGEEYNLGASFTITADMIGKTITFEPVMTTIEYMPEKEPVVAYFEMDKSTGKLKNNVYSFSDDIQDYWNGWINPSDIWLYEGWVRTYWETSELYTPNWEKYESYDTYVPRITVSYGGKLSGQTFEISSTISYANPDSYTFKLCGYRETQITEPKGYGAGVNVIVCIYEGQYLNKLTYMDRNTEIGKVENIQFGNSTILATPDIQRDGYKLIGWNIAVAEGQKAIFPLGSMFNLQGKDYVAEAVWEGTPNILVLNANGGTIRNDPYGQQILPYIVSTGQYFNLSSKSNDFVSPSGRTDELKGWYSGKDAGVYAVNCAVPITETTFLNAYWVKSTDATYTVSFNADGGEIVDNVSKQVIKQGDKIILPKVLHAPSGKVFAGWKDQSGNTIQSTTYKPTGNVTLTASWREGEPTDQYEVIFNTGETEWSEYVKIGDIIKRPTEIPTKDAAYFIDWVDSNGASFNFGQKVDENMVKDGYIVINAAWQQVFDTKVKDMKVTVTLDKSIGALLAQINWGTDDQEFYPFDFEVSHTYSGEGNYTIKVTVYETGSSHTVSKTVNVSQGGGGGDDPTPSGNQPDIVLLGIIIVAVIGGIAAVIVVARFIL